MLHLALALAPLLAPPAPQAEVWVVDAQSGPGTDFTSIDAAVAVDGDTILVRSGTYAPFPFGSKSLRVIADAGADVSVRNYVFAPPMDIGPLPAGATSGGCCSSAAPPPTCPTCSATRP